MSFNTVLRDGVANGFKQFYRAMGKTISYTHRTDSAVTLYADSRPGDVITGDVLGADTRQTKRTFFIPRQTNFPPTNGIQIGDAIVENSVRYLVERATDDGDNLTPQFEVVTVRDQATVVA